MSNTVPRNRYIMELRTSNRRILAAPLSAFTSAGTPRKSFWEPVRAERERLAANWRGSLGAAFLSGYYGHDRFEIVPGLMVSRSGERIETDPVEHEERACRCCGQRFASFHGTQLCSDECATEMLRAGSRERARARPSRAKVLDDRACEHCGDQFTPARADAKFCSVKCRVAAHRGRAAAAT